MPAPEATAHTSARSTATSAGTPNRGPPTGAGIQTRSGDPTRLLTPKNQLAVILAVLENVLVLRNDHELMPPN